MIDFCNTYRYGSDYEDYLVTLQENMSYFECIVPRWYTKYPGIQRISLDVKGINYKLLLLHKSIHGIMIINLEFGVLYLDKRPVNLSSFKM